MSCQLPYHGDTGKSQSKFLCFAPFSSINSFIKVPRTGIKDGHEHSGNGLQQQRDTIPKNMWNCSIERCFALCWISQIDRDFTHMQEEEPWNAIKHSVKMAARMLWIKLTVYDLASSQIPKKVECSGSLKLEDFGLFVPETGTTLDLPLCPEKLCFLIDNGHCEQAPIGRGTETIIDTDARKCWHMELGKKVLITSPSFLNHFVSSADCHQSVLSIIIEEFCPNIFGVNSRNSELELNPINS